MRQISCINSTILQQKQKFASLSHDRSWWITLKRHNKSSNLFSCITEIYRKLYKSYGLNNTILLESQNI